MKTLLKILLISGSLYACKNSGNDNNAANEKDSSNNITMPPDSVLNKNDNAISHSPDPGDFEKETDRQITLNLLSSKQEINLLRTEVSDSLSKSGLAPERRILFAKTIQQLESSSDLVNKQLEEILVSDLVNSRERLNGIIKKMKGSEKELGTMIARLDKVTAYMQIATNLMQSLLPIPATPVSSKNSK
jgi:hypothetical protein